MEEASIGVSTTKTALSNEIKAAKESGLSLSVGSAKEKLLNAAKI